KGGMGVVYRGRDSVLRREVALKVLPPELVGDGERKKRLLREARAAAALNHSNVVTVYDVVEQDSSVFVVMELVDGAPLRKSIGDEAVTLAKRVEWLCDVARALAAAHRAGFVHRDVKPENVLVTKDGAVKVLDFGIARPTAEGDEATTSTVTGEGVLLGTPLYMAPEQLDGAPIGGRADQCAW